MEAESSGGSGGIAAKSPSSVGMRVKILGLVKGAHHNNVEGSISVAWNETTERVGINLDNGVQINAKLSNIMFLSPQHMATADSGGDLGDPGERSRGKSGSPSLNGDVHASKQNTVGSKGGGNAQPQPQQMSYREAAHSKFPTKPQPIFKSRDNPSSEEIARFNNTYSFYLLQPSKTNSVSDIITEGSFQDLDNSTNFSHVNCEFWKVQPGKTHVIFFYGP